jgi:hypothetical protein
METCFVYSFPNNGFTCHNSDNLESIFEVMSAVIGDSCVQIFTEQSKLYHIAQAVSHWLPTAAARGSSPGLVMWDLWWTKWRWGRFFFPEYFGFPCQSSFHQLLHNHSHLSSGVCTIGQKWPQYLGT